MVLAGMCPISPALGTASFISAEKCVKDRVFRPWRGFNQIDILSQWEIVRLRFCISVVEE
jgi:hypothetical protein